jgi:hypothetical protein
MLAELTRFGDNATLIAESGVQFMDFGLDLSQASRLPAHGFSKDANGVVVRLDYDQSEDCYFHPVGPEGAAPGLRRNRVKPQFEIAVEDSLTLLNGVWLPIPMLRVRPGRSFDAGPSNWARARLVRLDMPDDEGRTHRLTIAFDTTLMPQSEEAAVSYLAPERKDVGAGHAFILAARGLEPLPFVQMHWVSEWIRDAYRSNATSRLKLDPDEAEAEIRRAIDVAHYLGFLAILDEFAHVPRVTLRSSGTDQISEPINVDLVLDVGNSRTCGILIEDHPQDDSWMRNRYELTLRDLSQPHLVYSEPFESRMEFNKASFGDDKFSSLSGRGNAFNWPSIARVGPEATRLAANRRGMEGATGLSSPKRYLWDEDRYLPGWRFNHTYGLEAHEPLATAQPFCKFINEAGEALFRLTGAEDDATPVFEPHYSRSSLMVMMLSEVLLQALSQINSPMQRMRQAQADQPRRLRRVVLTVPPSMPLPEQRILKQRMDDAVVLIWKSLGWHAEDADPESEENRPVPEFPEVVMKWDEVTCAQVVYLYAECNNHFGGDPRRFFQVMRRRDVTDRANERLRIASIDIGGGTTDLVVTDYVLQEAEGNAVKIEPRQIFRDGFKLAGDDILLQVIQRVILPAIEAQMELAGVPEAKTTLSQLVGAENLDVQRLALRHQFTLQVLHPAALAILHRYENFDPIAGETVEALTLGGLLSPDFPPQQRVLAYFNQGIRRASGLPDLKFDVLSTPIQVNLDRLHRLFLSEDFDLYGSLSSLCDVIAYYSCDVLLLTGRPSRLPGIPELIRALLPVTPDRVIPLHNYRAGTWYPFHRHGCIHDPKTTAAVGAMISVLAAGRLPNFNLLSNQFDLRSTMRYFGRLDERNLISANDVFLADLNLDDPDFVLPERPFPMSGPMRLGFRQIATPRWTATPLYTLNYSDEARQELHEHVLLVTLEKDRSRMNRRAKSARDQGSERFRIARVAIRGADGKEAASVGKDKLVLRLNTLNSSSDGATGYWLDTGAVYL